MDGFEEACGGWQSRRRHRRQLGCWGGERTCRRFDRLMKVSGDGEGEA